MKFTVQRGNWLRGEGCTPSFLRRSSDGKMCCLGFLSLACGFSEGAITNKKSPGDVESTVHLNLERKYPHRLYDYFQGTHPTVCAELMRTNDSFIIREEERELALSELFSSIGIEVVFED